MNKPKVSILCLTYNHEKYIKQALDSFLMQKTNFNFEILIHDDASTDKTTQIIKKYQKKYPKIIKPIIQTKNQYSQKKIYGLVNRFLLPLAKGKYIALCEGDDYWCDPNKLQISIDTLDKNPDCVMFSHNTFVKKNKNKKLDLLVDKNQSFEKNKFSLTNSIYTHLSARVFRNLKGLPPGDTFQYHYLLSKGKCYYYNKPMSVYRYNQKGVWSSLTNNQQKKANIKNCYLLNIFLKKKYNNYYSNLLLPEFGPYYNNFNKESSFILYLISIGFNFSDIFNFETDFIKLSIKETILWKFFYYIDNKTKIISLIKKNISDNQINKNDLVKIINSLKINKIYKFSILSFLK